MTHVYRAPGRVNLIGEHTDYNLGYVLPMALDLGCTVSVRPNGAGRLRVHSINFQDTRSWSLQEVREATPSKDWTDYVLGVAQQLERIGFETPDVDLEFESDLPIGGWLSSSAALEVATALGLLGSRKMDPLHVARLCHRAENEFVGLPCGIMDQFISVFGAENSALLINCRDESRRAVRLPDGVVWLAVNSMVKHSLAAGSAYAERVRECRDARPGDLTNPRIRHVASENQRVLDFAASAGRKDAIEMGRLMVASHKSLQKDYEVSCEELDFLVSTALSVQGVLGARMTGAGFGGCTVNLLIPQAETAFRDRIATAYRTEFGRDPEIYKCTPSEGARRIS